MAYLKQFLPRLRGGSAIRKSALLRRIITLLLFAVLLSGILSAGIYILVTQKMYVNMRAEELTPIARTVADMMTDAQQDNIVDRGIWPLLDRDNKNFLGASLRIYNSKGESIMNPPGGGSGDRNPNPRPDEANITQMISSDLSSVLSGKEVSGTRKSADGTSFLVVGVPTKSTGGVIGAVIFTKPLSELNDTLNGLNLTLLISTLAAFIFMLIPGYFAAKQIVVPIRRMGEVARAMAKGDFSISADETQKGEIGELGASINHFAAESSKLEQTRRDYVANVSHELRTPIAAIRAMGETLRDGMTDTPEEQNQFYNNMVRESMRMSRLVDDMLELSRLQSGREAMQLSAFNLQDVIRNAADVYSHLAKESGTELELPADVDTSAPSFSNPDRIEQVLVALLDNAIKHALVGSSVAITVFDKGSHSEVCVTNMGEEIPQEDLPYIFDRFYKTDKAHSGGGSGLGLSIAKEIMNLLGEHIWAESRNGQTKFFFTVKKYIKE